MCALCVKDKRSISSIIWKSTSIFIGTGRLIVQLWKINFASFYQLITKLVQEGSMGHLSVIRGLTFCINYFLVWGICMIHVCTCLNHYYDIINSVLFCSVL